MSKGNLVLGRHQLQSIVIADHIVVTVIDSTNGTLAWRIPENTTFRHVDSRTTEVEINNETVRVVVVGTDGKTVKIAIEAPKYISVDREEIHQAKAK